MFKSKLFLVIATVTLLILLAMVVMQVLEMKEFMLF